MKTQKEIQEIIDGMTLAEKASLCSGKDFWTTQEMDRLGIPSIMMTDGPHGLRKQVEKTDHLGLSESVPATCFPSGAGLASSWDRKLIAKVGKAIGKEALAQQVGIVLGPAVNIKRNPLCGRNFEYFSEDPYLTGELAKEYIQAVQSKGIGTSIKHFAANNQETRRMTIDTIVDERTLREIYLPGFEVAVKEAQPWTVMCAYNKINGVYCSENFELLTSILKKEWGHEGIVVTDWGACNDRVAGLIAGMELEMPGSYGFNNEEIIKAVQNGTLDETILNSSLERILKVTYSAAESHHTKSVYSVIQHHALARKIAAECMVLLKNDNAVLPIQKQGKIAVIGAFSKHPKYQGGGSSHIHPNILDNAYDEIEKLLEVEKRVDLLYADGYDLVTGKISDQLVADAVGISLQADTVVIFVGLRDRDESEGFDRIHMNLAEDQENLINKITEIHKKVIVVLSNGSPVAMPWIDKVSGLLEGYLGGEAGGGAMADLLFGVENPSAKLAETFPARLEDTSSYLNFPGGIDAVEYNEGLFVGYRYFDAKKMVPLFPFGYGLSYTDFKYSDIKLGSSSITDKESLFVEVDVENVGEKAGKEIVQLYVRDMEASVIRPEKELKGFAKIVLQPGERQNVKFELKSRAFSYWSSEKKDWVIEPGEFEILIGASSVDLRQKTICTIASTSVETPKFTLNTRLSEFYTHPIGMKILEALMQGNSENLMTNSGEAESQEALMMQNMLKDAPFRALVLFSNGEVTYETAGIILSVINGEIPVSFLGDILSQK